MPEHQTFVVDRARVDAALPQLPLALARGMAVALWASVAPDAPAIIAASGDRTFQQLNARVNQVARALRAAGIGPGDSIALMCSNRAEFAEVFWASRRSGVRLTTINWHLNADEATYIVDNCDAKALFIEARLAPVARALATRASKLQLRVAIAAELADFQDYEALLAPHDGSDIAEPQLGTQMLYTY